MRGRGAAAANAIWVKNPGDGPPAVDVVTLHPLDVSKALDVSKVAFA
jgi:hypothetical protein